MPGIPNRERVLLNLQATLQGITGPSYNFAVPGPGSVLLDPTVNLLTGFGLPDLPCYVIEPTPEGGKEYYPGEQLKEELIVNILGRVDVDSADALARMRAWEHMAADLELALEADTTRGGYAVDTRLLTPQPFAGVGSNAVILVQPVRITMYRAYRDGVFP